MKKPFGRVHPTQGMTALTWLAQAHPLLFRGSPPALRSSLPPGWYPLTDKLCHEIEAYLGRGGCELFSVRQVKAKFGGLRFYFSLAGAEDYFVGPDIETGDLDPFVLLVDGPPMMQGVRDLVNAAMSSSIQTCQVCGASGRRRAFGDFFATLCQAHQNGASF